MALLKDGTRIYGTLYANTAVVTGGINVAPQIESSFSQANAAFIVANTPTHVANSAGFYANGAFITANSSGNYANGAFTNSNTASINATGAFDKANAAFAVANAAASGSTDTWSRIQANLAYNTANTADAKGTSAGNYANGAFTTANGKFSSSGGTITGDVSITGNFSVTGCTTTLTVSTLQVQDNFIDLNYNSVGAPTLDAGIRVVRGSSNPTFLHWNETTDKWQFSNDGSTYANIGSDSDGFYANGAFTAANTADGKAVNAGNYANAAFALANSGGSGATSASNYANGAFSAANTADVKATSAGNYANGAFTVANNVISAANYANGAFTAANTADAKGTSAGNYANGAFTTANNFTNNITNAANYANGAFLQANTPSHVANSASNYSNAAYSTANSAAVYANAAFAKANSVTGTPGGTDTQVQFNDGGTTFAGNTNLTFNKTTGILSTKQLIVTNSEGDEGGEILLTKPATNTTISGTGVTVDVYQNKLRIFEQGGSARGFFLDITSGGGGASTDLNAGGFGEDAYARSTANSAGAYANAAFAQANTGGAGTDQFARDNSNAAFITANTADAKGTSAGNYANAAFAQANTGGAGTDTWSRVQANLAYSTANSAASYANAAFAVANTGGGGADAWARIQANLAYNAANSVSSLAAANTNVRTYTGDNTTVAFAVTSSMNANNVLIITNGLVQRPITDYTVASGNVTFVTAPQTGESISIRELSTSIDTSYVAANTSKWAGEVPSTIQVAINRLANSVYELNANTPISTSIIATAAAMAIALG